MSLDRRAPELAGECEGHVAAVLAGLRPPVERIIARAAAMSDLDGGPAPEPYATYALDIAEAARHLAALLGELCLDDRRCRSEGRTVDLLRVSGRAAAMLAPEATKRRIVLEIVGDGDGPHLAAGDQRRVRQILLNLIGNAVRYAPAGSVVRIAGSRGPGWVKVTVADEGPGLSPEEQLRIFDKFERLGRRDDGGSGVGLYISRRLARAMGGELTVESAAGQGSRFTLELPSA